MASFESYIVGAVAWGVWMVVFVILDTILAPIISISSELGGETTADPVSWLELVLSNWPLIGAVGLFVALLAVGVIESRRGP